MSLRKYGDLTDYFSKLIMFFPMHSQCLVPAFTQKKVQTLHLIGLYASVKISNFLNLEHLRLEKVKTDVTSIPRDTVSSVTSTSLDQKAEGGAS